MTQNKHTPWFVVADCDDNNMLRAQAIHYDDNRVCFMATTDDIDNQKQINANAEHIVKCVNTHDIILHEMEKLAKALEDTGHEPEQSYFDAMNLGRGA